MYVLEIILYKYVNATFTEIRYFFLSCPLSTAHPELADKSVEWVVNDPHGTPYFGDHMNRVLKLSSFGVVSEGVVVLGGLSQKASLEKYD